MEVVMLIKTILISLCLFVTSIQAAPKIQHWVTDNGVRIYFFPTHELPMMDFRVVFDAGAARDGEKHGLALLTNGLLAEGAANWNASEIAEQFEGVGATFSNSSHRDMAVLSLRSLTDPKLLNVATKAFSTVLTAPSFPQKAFDRERNRLLISLERQKQSPDSISNKAFYEALYEKHPYAHLATGDIDSVKSINVNDLKTFYKKYYVSQNAVVALVGDLTRKQAEALVDQIFKSMGSGVRAPKIAPVPTLSENKNVDIFFPSTQSHILLGQPGIKRGDNDYFPLYVANHVLGGSGLVSTLSDEIREKRGLAYSSYSYFVPMREKGPFIMGLQTKNESAGEALTVLREVLRKFVNNGPTQAELDAAKKNLVGGFALRIASNKKIVENLASIGFYQMPLDYLDTYIKNIESVTLDQVKNAFKRHINPDKMATVVVGDAKKTQKN